MASGDSYEILTQELFQTILDQTLVNTVEVQRDVWLQGKSTTHQIDVYWKFEVGGITHETIIQAKDWSKAVDQGELLKFRAVLDDLPGQPRGVFMTRTGYQSGAEDVARGYGIVLLKLEEIGPTDPLALTVTTLGYAKVALLPIPLSIKGSQQEGRSFIIEAITYEPVFSGSMLNLDPAWLSESGASEDEILRALEIPWNPKDVKLLDADGREVGDLHAIYKGFGLDSRSDVGTPRDMRHSFEGPTYARVPNLAVPAFKILSVTSIVTVNEASRVSRPVRLLNIVQFILENLSDGTKRIYGTRE